MGATCSYIQAQAGDGCWSLAQRCGISEANLTTYNSAPNFCSDIKVGQYICCSAGSLPDFAPKPYANGTCYTYAVKSGDTCSAIATANQMKEIVISTVNNETWGWAGCQDLQVGQRICLSTGTPPFPAPVSGTVCGPQVPGTVQPSNMLASNWTNLNPCPLSACCDVWGQCGISTEFCTPSPADTGAPGTAKPGTNGCISNCGTKVTNNANKPDQVKRIGYFESWNLQRPCLHMDISKLEGNSYYTHVHWSFANVTLNTWEVDVSGAQSQFEGLLKLTGIKRILSFGGWGFSTSPYTFQVFRNGVKDGNRQTFATNVVNFIVNNDLDGVDFDWEYPGAQDIPGIPPDSLDSGANYLAFLRLVRQQLPSTKTLSIAAPASYWYLKGFPIKEIAEVVDYIVYMTYDLHGQWDYGNKFTDSGCPTGGCLRSQVNKTETQYALAMITKAGVEARQIVAGLPLYGRSFRMAEAGCTGPECHFTGPASGALAGPCTDTPGYLANVEIYDIIAAAQNPGLYGNAAIIQYQDEGDVLIYDTNNWVSWLSASSYDSRRSWTDGMNFGGTSDWAVDLNQTYADNGTGAEQDEGYGTELFTVCDYSRTFGSLDDLQAAASGLRTDCIDFYALQVLLSMLDTAYANYTDVSNGYDALFPYYVTYIDKLVPEILADDFMWNMSTTSPNSVLPNVGYGMNYFNCVLGHNGGTIPCSTLKLSNDLRAYATALELVDENGYLAGLAEAGLAPDWVALGNYDIKRELIFGRGTVNYDIKFTGFPIKNSTMVVPNPQDIVTQGIGSIPALRNSMQATMMDIMLGNWQDGSTSDPAQVYSVPVFMLLEAVNSMAQAKQLAAQEKHQEAEQEKNFIILIVSVVLMFVPVIGEEAAAAAGLASLARAIALAGEIANGALSIYDTVQDPSSAVVNILGMLFGLGSFAKVERDGEGIASLAKIRNAMKSSEISSLGSIFKSNDDTLQSIMKVCNVK